MPTAENVFEKAKEQFDQPAMLIDVCNDFGRHVEQVRGNPHDAIAGRPRSASLGPAGPFVRRRLNQDHSNGMVGPFSVFLFPPQVHHEIPQHAGFPGSYGDRTLFDDALEIASVANAAYVTAAGGHDLIPQEKVSVPAVQDVAAVWFQPPTELIPLFVFSYIASRRDVHPHRNATIDFEVRVKPPSAVCFPLLVGFTRTSKSIVAFRC